MKSVKKTLISFGSMIKYYVTLAGMYLSGSVMPTEKTKELLRGIQHFDTSRLASGQDALKDNLEELLRYHPQFPGILKEIRAAEYDAERLPRIPFSTFQSFYDLYTFDR